MKVRCINNAGVEKYLTLNKIYKVIKDEGNYLRVIADNLQEDSLLKSRFEIIYSIEEIKNGKFAVELVRESDFNKFKKELINYVDFLDINQ